MEPMNIMKIKNQYKSSSSSPLLMDVDILSIELIKSWLATCKKITTAFALDVDYYHCRDKDSDREFTRMDKESTILLNIMRSYFVPP